MVLFVKQQNWQLLTLVLVISRLIGGVDMVRSVSSQPTLVKRSNVPNLFRRDFKIKKLHILYTPES